MIVNMSWMRDILFRKRMYFLTWNWWNMLRSDGRHIITWQSWYLPSFFFLTQSMKKRIMIFLNSLRRKLNSFHSRRKSHLDITYTSFWKVRFRITYISDNLSDGRYLFDIGDCDNSLLFNFLTTKSFKFSSVETSSIIFKTLLILFPRL